MTIRAILIGAGLIGLTACGGSGGGDYERSASPPPPAPVMAEDAIEFDGSARMKSVSGLQNAADEAAPEPSAGEPGTEQYIAYRHSLGLTLPKGQVDPLMAAHTQACRDAGTATCIVVNSNVYSQDEDYASGNLSIRATPAWIETFMQMYSRA